MKYRWFTFGRGFFGRHSKWRLITEQQIKRLITTLTKEDCSMSVASFTEDGELIEAPQFFADFDGEHAKDDVEACLLRCKEILGYEPAVYDSGNRGYHLISPIKTTYPHYAKLSKQILKLLGNFKSADNQIYRKNSILRIPNTYNTKGKRNKKLIAKSSLHTEKYKEIECKLIKQIDDDLAKPTDYENSECDAWYLNMPPCIKKIIKEMDLYGNIHNCTFILSRYMRSREAGKSEAFGLIKGCSWCDLPDKHIKTVINSVYNSTQSATFGCKDNEILEDRCSILCSFRR